MSFFNTEFEYKRALKASETVDATYYRLSGDNVPFDVSSVGQFFEDWPQYAAFPYIDKLMSQNMEEQRSAMSALSNYTIFIDRTIFIF